MLRNMKLQAAALVALGALLGYAASSGRLLPDWFAQGASPAKAPAADQPSAATCPGCRLTELKRDALVALAAHNDAAADKAAAEGKKPNILILWGDDIGWYNVSAYNQGVMGYRTPNIDRLAKEGAMFTDWYGQQSCTAGRSAFITGQSPIRTGLTKVGLPGSDIGLKKEDPTVAELLKPLGYACGQFGKNHLGDRQRVPADGPRLRRVLRQSLPPERRGRAGERRLSEEPCVREEVRPPRRASLFCHGRGRPDHRSPLRQGRQAEDRGHRPPHQKADGDGGRGNHGRGAEVHRQGAQGRQAILRLVELHRACTFGPTSRRIPRGRPGWGFTPTAWSSTTAMVGRLLKKLDDLGIADDTIVMYSTDNGAEVMTWPDGGTTPFRGEKNTNWEGGYRVPCLIRWPGVIKPGTVVNRHRRSRGHAADAPGGGGRAGRQGAAPEGQENWRPDVQGPPRRLRLGALLQGRNQGRTAQGVPLLDG